MRRVPGVLGIIVCSLLFIATDAVASIACTHKDVCRAYKNSVVIVVGKVTRLEVVKDESGKLLYELAHLRVTETFKGTHNSEVRIFNRLLDYPDEPLSDIDRDDANLRVGNTYLIYGAPENTAGTRVQGVLYVDACDEVQDQLLNKSRIRTLREYLKRGMPSQGVYEGNVVYYQQSQAAEFPVRGATVRITGEGFEVKQLVDRDGGFRFFDLAPGDYKASIFAPDGTLLHENMPFSLSDGAISQNSLLACGAEKFTTATKGGIEGVVDLPDDLSATTVLRSEFGEFRNDGDFEYEDLPPASYELLISSVYSTSKRLVYAHRPLLARINLKSGQRIENLEYTFTPRMRGRSTRISLESVPEECKDATFEIVVAYQNGVTTTFQYSAEQELILEKGAGSARLKAQCSTDTSKDVFVSPDVRIDPSQPPTEVTLTFNDQARQ